MADRSMCLELTLPLDGAPEVKGSAGYLTPHRVTWRVHAAAYGSRDYIGYWAAAILKGPGRTGRWRGAALYDLTEVPEWLPVPTDWIEDAQALLATLPDLLTPAPGGAP